MSRRGEVPPPSGGIPGKLSIRDLPLRGTRLFIRADFNVTLDSDLIILDDSRIRASLPTINYAIDAGARVVLASHLGRPRGKATPRYSLEPVARRLRRLLNRDVSFVRSCIGPEAEQAVSAMEDGDVTLLENLRFHPGEESNDDSFARSLSALADFYVNDAFGTTHRAHASITGVPRHLTAASGFLLEREIAYLRGAVERPLRPFVAILGGSKVSGKIGIFDNLLDKVDKVIIGGGMAYTFLRALGHEVGDSLVEPSMLSLAWDLAEKLKRNGVRFYLPVDVVIAQTTEPGAETKIVTTQEIPRGWRGLDIGPASVKLFSEALQSAKTILWNGPMGVFEIDAFSRGTLAVARAVSEAYALTIVGGGDTAHAVYRAGVTDAMSFISTGGGASLELLEGKELPGIAVLTDRPD
jgi:phosphoglycerate kinase